MRLQLCDWCRRDIAKGNDAHYGQWKEQHELCSDCFGEVQAEIVRVRLKRRAAADVEEQSRQEVEDLLK